MIKRLIVCVMLIAAYACAPQPAAQGPAAQSPEAQAAPPEPATSPVVTKRPAMTGEGRGPVLQGIVERGTLRVGTSGAQAPFTMQDRQGKLMGLDIDLANALGRVLELKVEFVTLPFGELLPAVESGKVDLALSSITMTLHRNLDVAFVGPYFVSGKALLTKDETLSKIRKTVDLNKPQVRLAALKGSTSERLISSGAPKATLSLFDTYEEGVKAVADGKVHALLADLPLVAVTLARFPNAGFAGVGDPLSFEPLGVAVPAYDAHFQNLVSNFLNLLEGSGTLKALRARWFAKTDWLEQLPPSSFGAPLDPSAQDGL